MEHSTSTSPHPAPQVYAPPPVRPDWLEQVHEDTLGGDQDTIDAHHHVFDPHGQYSTVPYLADELADDIGGGHRIVATVYVQAGWRLGPATDPARFAGETSAVAAFAQAWTQAARGPARVCAGIVAYADLRDPLLGLRLAEHEAAGRGRFRGIRQSPAHDPRIAPVTSMPAPPHLLRDPGFQQGLRVLGKAGYTYDAFLFHPQLAELVVAARSAPDTTVIVNHTGTPLGCGPFGTMRGDVRVQWLAGIRALAECPNVVMKLGGLGIALNGFDYHLFPRPPSSVQLRDDWRPWIEPCIELFGPERCMFEGNFPVDKGMFSYRVMWNAFHRLAAGASAAQRRALFHDTAARVYRIPGAASCSA